MPGTDAVTLRVHPLVWLQPVSMVLLGLVDPLSWRAVFFAFAAVGAVVYGRARTTLAPDGITACGGFRTRRLRWEDVEALAQRRPGSTLAVTRDGARVVLPNVRWTAAVPAEHVQPDSAQRVAQYAASIGHEVALEEFTASSRT